jgi:hypothetical protein
MMRLVFVFSAEERGLLLLGDPLWNRHYAVSTLRDQLREVPDENLLTYRHDAWSRLLATFRAIYAGVEHDQMRLPAYGGALFDPDRYPFLEGRALRHKLAERAGAAASHQQPHGSAPAGGAAVPRDAVARWRRLRAAPSELPGVGHRATWPCLRRPA